MKTILSLTFIVVSWLSCTKEIASPSGKRQPDSVKYSANELVQKFESAYEHSTDSMGALFKEWNESKEGGLPEGAGDTTIALYKIFEKVYLPHDLPKLGEWEWGNQNLKEKYVVVQNKLYYHVGDQIEENLGWGERRDSLLDFQPQVSVKREKVLYLTGEYKEALNRFLGSEHLPLGSGGIMNPALPAGESQKRANALTPFITLLHGHWGNYWHLETHPEVNNIALNKSLNKAKVFYRVGYMGGEAVLEKRNNSWVITSSKSTWIE